MRASSSSNEMAKARISFSLRARLKNQIHCRSRREEAQISDDLAKNQSLLRDSWLAHASRFNSRVSCLPHHAAFSAWRTFSHRCVLADLSTASHTYWVSNASRKVGRAGLSSARPSRKSATWCTKV